MNDRERYFLANVVAIARGMPAFVRVEPREEDFGVELVRGDAPGTFVAYLANLFAETRETSLDVRDAKVRSFLESVVVPEDARALGWDDIAPRLFSVLRPPSMFFAASTDAASRVAVRPVLPFLVEAIALDEPRTLSYVTAARLEAWGKTEEDAFAIARANLDEGLEHAIEPWDPEAAYPLWHVASGDTFEAARLLAPRFLRAVASRVIGELIVAVPERGTMLLAGLGSIESVARLLETAEREYAAAPRSISPVPYTIDDDGRASPWSPPPDHPLALRVKRAKAILANAAYAEQKRWLDDRAEQGSPETSEVEDEPFVASFLAAQSADDVVTYATWSRGVDSLLPVADRVMFVTAEDEDAFAVAWADVERIAGHLLEAVPDLFPARRRAKSFPNDALVAELRALAER